jgi:replication factor A1
LLFSRLFAGLNKEGKRSLKSKKPTLEDQLAFISARHNVYPTELFRALIQAKEQGKSAVEDLTVEYRGSVNDEAIFLIKKDNNVVAQFRVPEETLSKEDVSFDNWMDTSRVRKEIAKQTPTPSHVKIEDLRVGMKKVGVIAEVLETSEPSKVHTQFRDNALVSNAVIGDETGKILLCLWDQQVNAVSVGECIEVTNAHVAMFKGDRQLRLGKHGRIKKLETALPSKTA